MAEEEKVTEEVMEVSANGTCALEDTGGDDVKGMEKDGSQLKKIDGDSKENEETKDVKINGGSELSNEKKSQSDGKDEEKSEVEAMVEEGNDTKGENQCDMVEEKDGKSREEIYKVEETKEQLVKIEDGKEKMEELKGDEKIDIPENEEKKIEMFEDGEKKTEMAEDAKTEKPEDVREETEKPEDNREETENPEGNKEEIEMPEDKKGKIKKIKHRKPRIEKIEDVNEGLDKPEDAKEKIKKAEDGKEEKESKKRQRVETNEEIKKGKKTETHEKKAQEPGTPAALIVRPVRERKSVERLVASIERQTTKELRIGKGSGTALKDIPNVAYKLSRKRTDETFIVLHTILFGRRGKAFNVKSNLSKFSGFVGHENKEKQKQKIKEKFDKFVKEKLLEFCDVLDIHVAKATTRKEDIVAKLVNFLEAPSATTNVLLAEKEQSSKGKKRTKAIEKSIPKSGHTTAKRSVRKRRKIDETLSTGTAKNDPKTEESEDEDSEENNEDISDGGEEEMSESSDAEEKKGESEETAKSLKKGSMKDSSSKTKTMKATTPKPATPIISPKNSVHISSTKHSKNLDTTTTILSSRKTNEEDAKTGKKNASTPKTTTEKDKEKMGKKVAKEKLEHKEKPSPTEDEIREAACNILKEVDFDTATFTDILKKLVKHFGVDLTSRKVAIKEMVQEELAKLAPEEEDANDEDENEKNSNSASQ